MSQRERILAYLKAGNTLTVLDALQRFDCYALSQRIGGLKREGHPIITRMVRTTTGKSIAEYSYAAPPGVEGQAVYTRDSAPAVAAPHSNA